LNSITGSSVSEGDVSRLIPHDVEDRVDLM